MSYELAHSKTQNSKLKTQNYSEGREANAPVVPPSFAAQIARPRLRCNGRARRGLGRRESKEQSVKNKSE